MKAKGPRTNRKQRLSWEGALRPREDRGSAIWEEMRFAVCR